MLKQSFRGWTRGFRRKRVNRRASVRSSPAQDLSCHVQLPGEEAFVEAQIRNLSSGGTCLILREPLSVDSVVVVEIVNWSHICRCSRLLHIVRVFHAPKGGCVIAGAFDRPLSYDELLPFMI